VINSPTRETQARLNVLELQVREVSQHLFGRQAARQQIENIGDADTHSADARAPPALLRIDCDSLCQIRHSTLLIPCARHAKSTAANVSVWACAAGR
jgi:hypothetical protein